MSLEQGPYVQVAAFCDTIIEDKTNTISLIRIVDSLTHNESRPDAPEEMPAVNYVLKLVIMLKSGAARGRHDLKVMSELPSGETKPPFITSIQFAGEERGVNVIANIPFTFTMEGLHWFRVSIDDILLTKMPFRILYNRIITPPPAAG